MLTEFQVVSKEEFARIPGAKLHVRSNDPTHNIKYLRTKLMEAYDKYGWGRTTAGTLLPFLWTVDQLYFPSGLSIPCEDANTWKVSMIDSLCAKWIYRLNEKSRAYASSFNAVYNLQHSTPFIALQIRLTDKMYEMDPHQCTFSFRIRPV